MNVLMTGGHEEHEYDLFTMFNALGYNTKLPGMYGAHVGSRGYFDPKTDFDLHLNMAAVHHSIYVDYVNEYGYEISNLYEFIISRHLEDVKCLVGGMDFCYTFILQYAEIFSSFIPLILHLNGQMCDNARPTIEKVLDNGGLVVAYSQAQSDVFPDLNIPVIHFAKDPKEWYGWTGEEESVLYLANRILTRKKACHYPTFLKTRIEEKWWLAGADNMSLGGRAVHFTFEGLKDQMRRSRIFFNLGTEPASITLSVIEAAMTGMPIVTRNYFHGKGKPQYEVPQIFGRGCIVMDDPDSLDIQKLLNSDKTLKQVGRDARSVALSLFSKDVVYRKWESIIEGWLK